MKRMIIAVLIILFSVGFAVWESQEIDSILEDLYDTVADDSEKAYEKWQDTKDFLGVFLMHGDIDSIDGEMHAMREFSEADRKDEANESVIRIMGYIENIRQAERLSFGNVF